MTEPLKTGTTNVAIVCNDGLVLGADRRMTMGSYVAGKDMMKVYRITDKIGVTIAGSVSDLQLLIKLIKAEIALKEMQTQREIRVMEAANLLSNLCYNAFRGQYSIAAFLMGGVDEDGFHLVAIEPAGSVAVSKDYAVNGSGMLYAVGVLEAKFKPGLSLNEGVELAKDALNAALQRDSASGNGVDIWIISKKGVEEKFATAVNTGL